MHLEFQGACNLNRVWEVGMAQISRANLNCDSSAEDQALRCLQALDGLVTSTIMSFASMIPGFPGIAAAAGTVAFDLSQSFWIGSILSGCSMIPLIGYLPGGFKIAWNIRQIDTQLRSIEGLLPEIGKCPALLSKVREVADIHYKRICHIPMATPISSKLLSIIEWRG
jgi:hypothetical protein